MIFIRVSWQVPRTMCAKAVANALTLCNMYSPPRMVRGLHHDSPITLTNNPLINAIKYLA